MPGGDGTGPTGMGSMTGRASGFCAGYPVPDYVNPVGGRGMGMSWGRSCRGGGFGRGRGFGCGRAGYNLSAYGSVPFTPTVAPQQELDNLKGQAEYLKDSLDGIKKRIAELESQKAGEQ